MKPQKAFPKIFKKLKVLDKTCYHQFQYLKQNLKPKEEQIYLHKLKQEMFLKF